MWHKDRRHSWCGSGSCANDGVQISFDNTVRTNSARQKIQMAGGVQEAATQLHRGQAQRHLSRHVDPTVRRMMLQSTLQMGTAVQLHRSEPQGPLAGHLDTTPWQMVLQSTLQRSRNAFNDYHDCAARTTTKLHQRNFWYWYYQY